MTRNALILIAAVGLAAAILILWRGSAATEAAVQDQAVIALGQRLYAENCATCQGADLEGQPDWQTPLANGRYPAPPHDETGHTWHHADALLERIIRDGTAAVVGRWSDHSLYSEAHVTFEEDAGAYDQKDAAGFIKINALRLRLLGMRARR